MLGWGEGACVTFLDLLKEDSWGVVGGRVPLHYPFFYKIPFELLKNRINHYILYFILF